MPRRRDALERPPATPATEGGGKDAPIPTFPRRTFSQGRMCEVGASGARTTTRECWSFSV
jgi:hypothetical protein